MARFTRLQTQQLLEDLLGTRNVYFQPKEKQELTYPAIVYKLEAVKANSADGIPYTLHDRFQVTYIDRSPDSDVPRKIQSLPMARFTSYFVIDGLNHYNHSIHF